MTGGELFILVAVVCLVFLVIRAGRAASKAKPNARAKGQPKLSVRPRSTATKTAIRSAPAPKTLEGPAYIIDGDSLRIQKSEIRLFGVDAPEMNHPHGRNAKWALVALCKGHKIRAEVTQTDIHGRTVARCYLPDGRDLSAEMVKAGFAIDWPKFSGGVYRTLEVPDARKKMWLADARQKGRMHVWEKFEANNKRRQG